MPVSIGHADHQRAARREQTLEGVEHRRRIDDVLQHFHAVDRVVGALVRRALQVVDEDEVQALLRLEPLAAVGHDRRRQLRAHSQARRRLAVHQQTEERPVAAAVIERARAVDLARETEPCGKASAVTPRDQPRSAVDLLLGVKACADRIKQLAQAAALSRAYVLDADRRTHQAAVQLAECLVAAPLTAHIFAAAPCLLTRGIGTCGDGHERVGHRAGIAAWRQRRVFAEMRRHAAHVRGDHGNLARQRFERRQTEALFEGALHQCIGRAHVVGEFRHRMHGRTRQHPAR